MQKEDLIKRLRIFAAVITTVFVVMVVALLIQFGFIAHYHNEIRQLNQRNDQIEQDIEHIKKDIEYWGNAGQHDAELKQSGEQQN